MKETVVMDYNKESALWPCFCVGLRALSHYACIFYSHLWLTVGDNLTTYFAYFTNNEIAYSLLLSSIFLHYLQIILPVLESPTSFKIQGLHC